MPVSFCRSGAVSGACREFIRSFRGLRRFGSREGHDGGEGFFEKIFPSCTSRSSRENIAPRFNLH